MMSYEHYDYNQNEEDFNIAMSELFNDNPRNPLQLNGLMHVIEKVYTQGMPLEDLQTAIGNAVQSQLMVSLQNNQDMNQSAVYLIYDFLQEVDNGLTLGKQQVEENGKAR